MGSDRPTSMTWEHRPLRVAVEDSPGSRVFLPDPRLNVESLRIGCDDQPSRAVLTLWLGPMAGDADTLRPADIAAGRPRGKFTHYFRKDQAIQIYRDLEVEDDDSTAPTTEPYFVGVCPELSYSEKTGDSGTNQRLQLIVEGEFAETARAGWSQITGRIMRTSQGQADLEAAQARDAIDAFGDETQIAAVPGLPAVFNAFGRPNRAAAPINAHWGDTDDTLVHVFTYDGDPDAKPWTVAQAWRHLLYFYLLEEPKNPQRGLVFDGNVIDETAAYITREASSQPAPPVAIADAMEFALTGRVHALNVDGMNGPEAMIALCLQAGLHLWCKTVIDDEVAVGEGEIPAVYDELRIWPRGAGTVKSLYRTPIDNASTPARTVLDLNNVKDLSVTIDTRDLIIPKVLGDIKRHEVTVELVPGWTPDANLDAVADYVTALNAASEHLVLKADELPTDPWWQKYHRNGDEFPQYRNVGRRWVLNTSGLYKADDYQRTYGPYKEAAYKPWEPSDADIAESFIDEAGNVDEQPVAAGAWSRRVRPFQPCVSADDQRRSLNVVVEVSFDEGDSWVVASFLAPRALEDDSAIVFDVDDLAAVYDPDVDDPARDDAADSVWDAILQNKFRVRVTALIDSDSRVEARLDPAALGVPDGAATRVYDLSQRFTANRRDSANSQFADDGDRPAPQTVWGGGDQLADLQRFAQELFEATCTRAMPATVVIPYITSDYRPGHSIDRIEGLNFELTTGSKERRYVDVVGIEYQGSVTVIGLDDTRELDRISRLGLQQGKAGRPPGNPGA